MYQHTDGDVYLSTLGNLNANGFTADLDDIVHTDRHGGRPRSCRTSTVTRSGLANKNIDGLHIQRAP